MSRLLPARLQAVTVTVELLWTRDPLHVCKVSSVTAAGSYNYFFYQMLAFGRCDGTEYHTNQASIANAL